MGSPAASLFHLNKNPTKSTQITFSCMLNLRLSHKQTRPDFSKRHDQPPPLPNQHHIYFHSLTDLSWLAEATIPVSADCAKATIKPSCAWTVILLFSAMFHNSRDCNKVNMSSEWAKLLKTVNRYHIHLLFIFSKSFDVFCVKLTMLLVIESKLSSEGGFEPSHGVFCNYYCRYFLSPFLPLSFLRLGCLNGITFVWGAWQLRL